MARDIVCKWCESNGADVRHCRRCGYDRRSNASEPEAFESFDCEQAAHAYRVCKWRWSGVGIPSAQDIRQTIEALAISAARDRSWLETGGLSVGIKDRRAYVRIDGRLAKAMDEAAAEQGGGGGA